ncbi:hypothetical protein [Teredinibacter sp. KSP-S5-2]|uniref:hypothetical protein n=1 Tax=Teredinibacter sp. KSP-S5-2 TaxID=3034506 RepID=UPI00293467BE|nr:hypothetical protein [Teredinibacter sp. KSP-S5-2]WNO11133.1 hypothetical protein P5V12_08105 [Teredinibacter sp. KSP-S5-2]
MKIYLRKNQTTNEYDTISWESSNKDISLSFPFEISAVYADKISKVIVEKYELQKIGFYVLNGELEFETDIPSIKGYKFRGLNKNLSSKTGVSLLFYPDEPGKGNQWGDIEQYELVEGADCLGKYLDIYR